MTEEDKKAIIDIIESLHSILIKYDKSECDHIQKIVASIAFIGAFIPSPTIMKENLMMMRIIYDINNVKDMLSEDIKKGKTK